MEPGYTSHNDYRDFGNDPATSFPRNLGGSAASFVTAPPAPVYSPYSPALQAITRDSLGPAARFTTSTTSSLPGPDASFPRNLGGSAARFTPSAAPSSQDPAASFPRDLRGSAARFPTSAAPYSPVPDASFPRDLGASAARFTTSTTSSLPAPAVATPIDAKAPSTVYIHPQPVIPNAYRSQPVHPVPSNTGGAAVVARVPTPSLPVLSAAPNVASTPVVVPPDVNASRVLDNQVLTTLLIRTMTENKLLVGRVSKLEEKLEECMVRLVKVEEMGVEYERRGEKVLDAVEECENRMLHVERTLKIYGTSSDAKEKIAFANHNAFLAVSQKVDFLGRRVARDIDRLDKSFAKKVNCHLDAPAPSVVPGPGAAADAVLLDPIALAPAPAPAPVLAPAPAPAPASAVVLALEVVPAPIPDPTPVLDPAAVDPSASVPTTAPLSIDPVDESVSSAPALITPAPAPMPVAAVAIAKIDVVAGVSLVGWLEAHVSDHARIVSELEKALSDAHVVIFGNDITPKHLQSGMRSLAFPLYSFKPHVRDLCMEGKAVWDESCIEMDTNVCNYQHNRKHSVPFVAGTPDLPLNIWRLSLAVFLLFEYAVCKEIRALVEIKE